jgi:hypothetical protein
VLGQFFSFFLKKKLKKIKTILFNKLQLSETLS